MIFLWFFFFTTGVTEITFLGGSTSCLQCVISIWEQFERNPWHTWSTNHFSCKYFSFVKENKPRGESSCPVKEREARADRLHASLRLQMLGWPPHGNFAHTVPWKRHTVETGSEWIGLQFIRNSLFASPRLLNVFYIPPVEGVSRYQQISIVEVDCRLSNVEETENSSRPRLRGISTCTKQRTR